MRLVYVVVAHKNPGQLARMVSALTTGEEDFVVHIDGKQDIAPFVHALDGRKAVHFVGHRVPVYTTGYPPGTGYSQARAILSALDEACSGRDFDYVVLLSGQDYPIKRNDEIHAHFERHRGKEFLGRFPLSEDPEQAAVELKARLKRIERWYVEDLLRAKYLKGLNTVVSTFLPKRKFPAGYRPYWGSVYWRFTSPCARFVVDFAREHPDFIRFFRFVGCPDEYVFHTIVLNSPFAGNVVDDNLTYMDWPCTFHPKTLMVEHFPALARSEKLFARKFDVVVDERVLELIDTKLLGRVPVIDEHAAGTKNAERSLPQAEGRGRASENIKSTL